MILYSTRSTLGDDVQRGDRCCHYVDRRGNEHGVFYYRCSPVPNVGHKIRYSRYLRSPHTLNEMKLNTDPEYKQYTRPARRNLPTLWDDIPVGFYKGWKHCTKKRKQWM